MSTRARLVALAASITVLVVVASQLDWPAVVRAWGEMVWPWAVASACVNLLNTLLEAARWQTVVKAGDHDVPVRQAYASMLVGTVGNVLLPFKLGEAARAWALGRLAKLPMSTVWSTVILDRVVDGVVLTLLITGLALASTALPLPRAARYAAVGFVGSLLLLWLIISLMRRWLGSRIRERLGSHRAHHLDGFLRGFRILRQHHALGRAGAFAVASWLTRVAVVWLMFKAFALDWTLLQAAFVLLAINAGILVVSTPANVGSFELAAAGVLRLLGCDAERAISYALALHLAEVIPPTLLGIAVMWSLGLHLDRAAFRSAQAEGSLSVPEGEGSMNRSGDQ
jgi:glycosyltransferase 2 family protein